MKANGIQKIGRVLSQNSPLILIGMSVAGLVTTVVMAVRVTPKAVRLIENAKYNLALEEDEQGNVTEPMKLDFTTMDVIKTTWKLYIPAVIMGGVTISCIIGANSINLRRNAALASVYSLTEATLKEYQEKVVETIGKGKEQKIKDGIAKDRIIKNPPNDATIIITGKGETLCYDALSGRYFKSDIESIRKILNELNSSLMNEMTISLNDVYFALGMSNIKLGEELGWTIDDGLMEFHFSSQLSEDGIPCLVIDYTVDPLFDYRNRH